jgi:hypothetical protein
VTSQEERIPQARFPQQGSGPALSSAIPLKNAELPAVGKISEKSTSDPVDNPDPVDIIALAANGQHTVDRLHGAGDLLLSTAAPTAMLRLGGAAPRRDADDLWQSGW